MPSILQIITGDHINPRVKQVPDSWAEKSLSPADYTLDRGSVDAVINEIDEYAI